MKADLVVHGHPGETVFRLRPMTQEGEDWCDEFVDQSTVVLHAPVNGGGRSIVVEHRYILPIVEGAREAGLTVEVVP